MPFFLLSAVYELCIERSALRTGGVRRRRCRAASELGCDLRSRPRDRDACWRTSAKHEVCSGEHEICRKDARVREVEDPHELEQSHEPHRVQRAVERARRCVGTARPRRPRAAKTARSAAHPKSAARIARRREDVELVVRAPGPRRPVCQKPSGSTPKSVGVAERDRSERGEGDRAAGRALREEPDELAARVERRSRRIVVDHRHSVVDGSEVVPEETRRRASPRSRGCTRSFVVAR